MENTQNNLVGMNQNYLSEEELLSVQSVAAFTHIMVDIIDDRIRKRLSQEDIPKVYNAKISNLKTTTKTVSRSVTEGSDTTTITHKYNTTEVSSVTVLYDDKFSVTISNNSVKQLPTNALDKWVKICTYDDVQFYVLHMV